MSCLWEPRVLFKDCRLLSRFIFFVTPPSIFLFLPAIIFLSSLFCMLRFAGDVYLYLYIRLEKVYMLLLD